MKIKTIRLATLLIIILLAISNVTIVQAKAKETNNHKTSKSEIIQLFNGKDLNNWVFKLKDPSIDPSTVFTIKNGLIHISGNPFGYMRTKDIYSDYKLHVEWRWPTEATNSGVFLHFHLNH